jgi:molybdenum cofactor cytidylyltransferase
VSHNGVVTVAAVILAPSPDVALAEADGLPRARRLADVAWAGGALPIVVVVPDPEGSLASALAGAPVVLAEPSPTAPGPASQMVRGLAVAAAQVQETDGALLWPASIAWAGPETVTSLIEAHGLRPEALISPAWQGRRGWPVLVPLAAAAALRSVPPDLAPDEILAVLRDGGLPELVLDLGDPGTVFDGAVPRSELPAYLGPAGPIGGLVHEWGAPIAEEPDEGPLAGPALAPYPQAAGDGDD